MWRSIALLIPFLLLFPMDAAGLQQGTGWLRAELGGVADDQPVQAAAALLDAGWFVSPNVAAGAVLDLRSTSVERPLTVEPGARLVVGVPAARLGLDGVARVLLGAPGAGSATPLHDLRARVDLGHGTAARAGTRRDRYTATLASLDTLVLRSTDELAIDRSSVSGFAFEAVARRERFGDGNVIQTAFAWSLLPIHATVGSRIRLGYAFAWQDAMESRWAPDPAPPGGWGAASGATPLPGRYDPYYTPDDLVVHSVLAEGVAAAGAVWITARASYGVRASEQAPTLRRDVTQPFVIHRDRYRRSFHPANLVVAIDAPFGGTAVRVEARHDRGAYYRASGVRLILARSVGGG